MKWKIYYGDGSTFSDQDGAAENAPAVNVQVIVVENPNHNWVTIAGNDYFVWQERGGWYRWWGADWFGMVDYLLQPGWKKVLFGRMIDEETFNGLFRLANKDSYFGKKTSFANGERLPSED